MANWCSNMVSFHADESTMQLLRELFCNLAERERQTHCGQLSPFMREDGRNFHDIRWEADNLLYYESRWMPNLDELVEVADFYRCGFACTYKQPNDLVYGRATYSGGVLTDKPLDYGKQ